MVIRKVQVGVHQHRVARGHDRGGLALLDDGRAGDTIAVAQHVAVVDGGLGPAALEPGVAHAFASAHSLATTGGTAEGEGGGWSQATDAEAHGLDRGICRLGGVAGDIG